MHPTHDGGVGHRHATLGYHLYEIPEAELEPQIPTHAQDDDLTIEVPSLEQLLHTQELGHRLQTRRIAWTIQTPADCTRTVQVASGDTESNVRRFGNPPQRVKLSKAPFGKAGPAPKIKMVEGLQTLPGAAPP